MKKTNRIAILIDILFKNDMWMIYTSQLSMENIS